mmetsp:Transcript_99870/g.321932  ORF Transcript_99870/g.321932 Transcript_99870/m.321932 type:complete len:202 (-) Transcript_99870:59-664(-)
MRRDQGLLGQASQRLQRVDVLGVAAKEQSLLMQEGDEVVCEGRPVLTWPQLLAEHVEGSRVLPQEVQIKDCFWIGQVVLFQVVVQACPWSAEVGDAGCNAHASADHDHDPPALPHSSADIPVLPPCGASAPCRRGREAAEEPGSAPQAAHGPDRDRQQRTPPPAAAAPQSTGTHTTEAQRRGGGEMHDGPSQGAHPECRTT